MAPGERRALQWERLQWTLQHVRANVKFYRERLGDHTLSGLEGLSKLPFTCKEDLRDQYPFGLLAVPQEALARVHATSGTRGKPTLVGYSRRDLMTWSRLCARLLTAAGGGAGDRIHIALNYGLFTGGLGIHGGAELLGCTVIPASAGSTQQQITLLADLRPQGLKATPSYALHLAEMAEQQGIDPRSFGIQYGIFGAEPWSEAVRDRLEARFGLTAYDSYGLSEMLGPGVAYECGERDGLHLSEDHFLSEIIDPKSGRSLPPGEEGELVLTSLTKEAFPLIRYRTGDRTALLTEPCRCGRTTARIARLRGRVDEMVIVRGVNLYPSEVERVLLRFPELLPRHQIRVWKKGALDAVEALVEARLSAMATPELAQRIGAALKRELGVAVGVRFGEVPASEGRNKALRVIDERYRTDVQGGRRT
ncbi:MAG: phenylacetate--CoA ligase family protein [Bacillota bacterium]